MDRASSRSRSVTTTIIKSIEQDGLPWDERDQDDQQRRSTGEQRRTINYIRVDNQQGTSFPVLLYIGRYINSIHRQSVISTICFLHGNLLSPLLRLTSASKKHTIRHQVYGLHPRAHDVYNVGNILLMLTGVVIAMLTGYSVTCTHHAHTLAHPPPTRGRERKKKGRGCRRTPMHAHARTHDRSRTPKGWGKY